MINIVVALACEAKPLVQHYHLQRQQQHTYPVYAADNMQLIVSGVGMLNAATATGYLAGLSTEPASWLNLGIAGHRTHEIGSLYLAHKISHQQDQQTWYPSFTFKTGIATEALMSINVPLNEYRENMLHDMEAAGFYQAASHFNSSEFIHSLKIISDNAEQSTKHINKQMVNELITKQLETITGFIERLANLSNDWRNITNTPDDFDELLQRWHFSTYQQHQLKQLVQRWTALYPGQAITSTELLNLQSGRDVLRHLQNSLDIRTGY